MSDIEVALELTKIILGARRYPLKDEKEPQGVVLSTYRDALAAVRQKTT